jgi:hypothetical protein
MIVHMRVWESVVRHYWHFAENPLAVSARSDHERHG